MHKGAKHDPIPWTLIPNVTSFVRFSHDNKNDKNDRYLYRISLLPYHNEQIKGRP